MRASSLWRTIGVMSMSVPERVVAGAVVLVVLACVLVTWAALRDHPGSSASPDRPSGTTPAAAAAAAAAAAVVAPGARQVDVLRAVGSLAILRDWDRARAEAWAAGDVRALRRLYTPGSTAGQRDAAMLRRWTARGLQVRGMSMQVIAVELRRRTDRTLVLVVTDRLSGAEAVGPSGSVELPRDGASTRRLSFREVAGRWLLRSAQEVPRPVASTASTSGSAKE